MARRDGIRRGSRRSFSGLLITAALHAAVFWAVKEAHSQPQGPLIVERNFVEAEMVKLGKPRDKFWLPKAHRDPPPPPPDAIKLSDNPDAKAAPVEAPKVNDPKTSKIVQNALKRAAAWDTMAVPPDDEGLATGHSAGTATEAKGDPYLAEVSGLLRQNYNLPAGVTVDQIPIPPVVRFTIGADGTLSNIKLDKSSTNPLVDDACVSAPQLTRKVPPPPGGKARKLAVECQK
ncbi:MAG TPA: TonB family protein [Polyangia bacterium]